MDLKKKSNLFIIAGTLIISTFNLPIQAGSSSKTPIEDETKKKDEVMLRDQVDDTDIYAIPLDTSEFEDEQQINRLENKQVFDLDSKKK